MKHSKIKIILLTSASFLMANALTPAMAMTPLPSGWYLEGNAGKVNISNSNYVAGGSSLSTSGRGWNINGGYKFMPFSAVEIGYTNYANASAKVNGIKLATATNYSYDLAGKGILPIGDTGAELFAKLGIVRLSTDVKESNPSYAAANNITVNTGSKMATGYYVGLGADYTFWSKVAVVGQWQRAKGNNKTGNLSLYSIGLNYLFG